MKKVKDLKGPFEGYCYLNSIYKDLMELITEYMGEAEHNGMKPGCREISSDTVDDVKEWCEKRKQLLIKDFLSYWGDPS